jgi:ABC-type sulfate/molybdate transport systems ATPase subunit
MLHVHIVKARRDFTVDVTFKLGRGECLALFGPSGAGKSTVLSCLAGFEDPDSGHIQFGEFCLFPPNRPLHQRPLGFLSQSDLLFPHLTVAQNICFGLPDYRLNGSRLWVEELKNRLGLDAIWNESSRRISGGQARRVALARMLARRPPLLLLDEPFTALDRAATDDLIDALLEWRSTLNLSIIAVDHRVEILSRLCPRAAIIERGSLLQEGSWQALQSAPATPLLARLLSVDWRISDNRADE